MTTPDKKRNVLVEAWRLAAPYWRSNEKWAAWGLLVVIVALNLGSVWINVELNTWRGDFFNALQDLDQERFFWQLGKFSMLAGTWIIVVVYQQFLNQLLQLRWRRWMTTQYLDAWLDARVYYRLQLSSGTDNPDQRIADDLRLVTSLTLGLGLGILNAVVSLASFAVILWGLSGDLPIPLGPLGEISIPGYMLWVALVYAIGGTIITRWIGRPLISLNFDQQRYEADFRYSLIRLRENAESVAFYRGEARENATFRTRFGSVVDNFWAIMKRQKTLTWFTSGYGQIAVIFPYVVAAPRFFSKEIQLGGLQQVAGAFGEVQSALSFIISSYTDIATWQAVVDRIVTFRDRTEALQAEAAGPQSIDLTHQGTGLSVDQLTLALPDGRTLREHIDLDVAAGEGVLIAGPSGTGKSTLLRAVSGIWPFGKGAVRVPAARALFVPQKPYIPLGTLRNALAYPDDGSTIPAERISAALAAVGLGTLAGELDTVDQWSQRLSLGEQQRLAFARVILAEPAIVFLDEATSALDEPSEAALYSLLRQAPWKPTVVSVGHRSTLKAFHDRQVDMAAA